MDYLYFRKDYISSVESIDPLFDCQSQVESEKIFQSARRIIH